MAGLDRRPAGRVEAAAATVATAAVLTAAGCAGSPGALSESTPSADGATTSVQAGSAHADAASDVIGTPRVLVRNLDVPWGLVFLPDGDALVSERDTHRIVRVAPDGDTTVVGEVQDVADDTAEGGLLGLAVPPDFRRTHKVYAYITSDADNRIVRLTIDSDTLSEQEPVFTGIPRGAVHDGGRIAFGPDGMLYATTGDATQPGRAQDPSYLGGKVLRMTPDGDPAPGNPDPDSAVYTRGHRNPEGLAWGPGPDPVLYEAEFGASKQDELNILHPGGNYGWPEVEGTAGPVDDFAAPVRTWPTDEASPSGLAFAGGSLWLATLQGEDLFRMPVGPDGSVGEPRALLVRQYGRLRTVAAAPDGSLWVATSNRDGRGTPADGDDRIIRIPLT